ncbi:MAG: hypothetical protein R3E44_07745 [Paracoccaceae bacterium]
MPKQTRAVLSIIVRRFDQEFEEEIGRSLARLQRAAAEQPGYLGEQNSLTRRADGCELVTVFVFDSRANLERWENSAARERHLAELDRHPQEITRHTRFDELARLLDPGAGISRIEIVAILIFWIVILGEALRHIADLVLPDALQPFWRNLLMISVNVVLISYAFLPWSSIALTRLKARFSQRGKRN